MSTNTHERLSEIDLSVLRVINTGPVTLHYIKRMLRLPDNPYASIVRLQTLGYLKPDIPDTVGFYLTGEGRRALLRS